MALYHKYRPVRLDEVIGQDHITRTIKNSFLAGRLPHALLFVGERGTGKTTVARIVSRLVNCECPQQGEPCNLCKVCKDILEDRCADIIEMDAASNRGVDDIEDLRERVRFPPMEATRKVYIIDEVHQLSATAKDALLKTLEDPPKHAMFILATTEGHRIPLTVRSRCQLHSFRRATIEDILTNLTNMISAENIPYDEAGLKAVARDANGSFRDSVTILEGLMSMTGGVSLENIQTMYGLPSSKVVQEMIKILCTGDPARTLAYAAEARKTSLSLDKFTTEVSTTLFRLAKRATIDKQGSVLGLTVPGLISLGTYIAAQRAQFTYTEDTLAFELIMVGAAAHAALLGGRDPWQIAQKDSA